ncbi:hypothetical protein [Clostridium beijerinckii]|uniref:hypothetical protein n=1 Tax=Clostridium beijerinckii TaxID=1520 RepID=UPI001F2CD9A9|nr:hypothetical protein [Clostridium beijerinckii]
MFYDKEIYIYKYDSFEDKHRIDREGYKKISEDSFLVDIQPYNSEKAKREYGYDIECSRKMFCDVIPEIKEDSIIKYNNKFYEIKAIPWDDEYYEILLNETKDVNILKEDNNE